MIQAGDGVVVAGWQLAIVLGLSQPGGVVVAVGLADWLELLLHRGS